MKQFSISLGKFFGIPAKIHWTFWILIIWIIFSSISKNQGTAAIFWYVFFVFVLFACVVLHELGHALAARRYGIQTKSITILPIGGVASLESIPEDPKKELVVAIAGPLVNVGIAILLFIFLSITGQFKSLMADLEGMATIHAGNFLMGLLFVNIMLVVFNLIPAFPMDGGRMFRAFLAMKMDRVKATQWAVNLGKVFAILFVFWGFYGNPFLIFIALFIFLGAQAELQHVKTGSLLKGYKVKDIIMKDYTSLHPFSSLAEAVQLLLNGQEERFLVKDGLQVIGILTKMDIIRGLTQFGESAPVQAAMQKNVQWLHPDTSLESANEVMIKNRLSFMPVGMDGFLLGVLDSDNLNEFMMVRGALRGR